jgi:hypothetical protein
MTLGSATFPKVNNGVNGLKNLNEYERQTVKLTGKFSVKLYSTTDMPDNWPFSWKCATGIVSELTPINKKNDKMLYWTTFNMLNRNRGVQNWQQYQAIIF